jgi:hypothetical protein
MLAARGAGSEVLTMQRSALRSALRHGGKPV